MKVANRFPLYDNALRHDIVPDAKRRTHDLAAERVQCTSDAAHPLVNIDEHPAHDERVPVTADALCAESEKR